MEDGVRLARVDGIKSQTISIQLFAYNVLLTLTHLIVVYSIDATI